MRPSERTQRTERLLAADHAGLDELLRALDAALAGEDAPAALARLDLFWARLGVHIRAENLCLFPAILTSAEEAEKAGQLAPSLGGARADIARLRADHDFFMKELARGVKTLREVTGTTGGDPALNVMREVRRSVRALAERLAAHNGLEEERVYRLPAVTLGAAEQSSLATRVERELGNLPPRFS